MNRAQVSRTAQRLGYAFGAPADFKPKVFRKLTMYGWITYKRGWILKAGTTWKHFRTLQNAKDFLDEQRDFLKSKVV